MLKKIILLILLVAVVFSLVGCEIHFADGTRYEVPWWVAALFAVPFLIIGAILIYVNMPNEFWAYCPKCEGRFYVKKRVFQLSNTHSSVDGIGFYYKCPCCKTRHICYKSWDN